MASAGNVPVVAIVDDQVVNFLPLTRLLARHGYDPRSYAGGPPALDAAQSDPPDVYLLDVNMPDMSGYEVCRRLKSDPRLASIPVIFLSGNTDPIDKVQAFGCGGVDYIEKPFEISELCARLQTHLRLRELQRQLERHNSHLDELVQEKSRELAEANARLAIVDRTKTDMLSLISHELRTPLNGVLGVTDLVFDECPATPEVLELRQMFDSSRDRLLRIIDDALLLAQVDVATKTFVTAVVPFAPALAESVAGAAGLADESSVRLTAPEIVAGSVRADRALLIRGLQALIETGVKFTSRGGETAVSAEVDGAEVVVHISARGRTVPEISVARFFDIFGAAEVARAAGDTGLRPALADRILSLFGGKASVEVLDPPGLRLTVRLPRG